MALFSKGIMLAQHKEPALSRDLAEYMNPHPANFSGTQEIPTDPKSITADEIINIARIAQIFDEDDGILLASKLRRMAGKAITVLIDAVDDEPYVSSKLRPMLTYSKELIIGMELCGVVAGTRDLRILVYQNMGDMQTTIPRKIDEYPVERLAGGYPALPSSAQLSRMRSTKKGDVLIIGAGAAIHLARAVTMKMSQATTFVTVHGNCVANALNLEVSLGMNFTEILERCGLVQEPTRVVAGGPMTGIAVLDTDTTLITHTTRAVLAFRDKSHEQAYACIGCGLCEKFCPTGLDPMNIHKIMKNQLLNELKIYDPQYCIGCGTCSYVCPSRLHLVGATTAAKEYALEHFASQSELEEEHFEV